MRLIGITGSSGSGKSTVAEFFARCGYTVIDGDGISRELAVPGSAYVAALVNAFGPGICDETGALDRRAMGAVAFSCPENQKKLTAVTTPLILDEVRHRMAVCAERGERLAFLDGAIILGGPFQPLCEKVIAVLTDRETQLSRIAARDGISRQGAEERLSRQWTNEQMAAAADICLYNTSTKEELLCRANEILNELINEE